MSVQKHFKRVTIADVATEASVTKAAVSLVLNHRPKAQTFTPQTRERIFEAARKLNYKPNAAARALATSRTRNLGFILSDAVSGGWTNTYFARQLTGVEEQCRKRSYGLQISRYNLQNLDQFIFPEKVGQKSVDGLILSGYVTSNVLARFSEFNIPCVCIGDNIEKLANITTLGCDVVGGFCKAIEHVAPMGHKRIGYASHASRRDMEILDQVNQRCLQSAQLSSCQMVPLKMPFGPDDPKLAEQLLDDWLQMPEPDRPTVLVSYGRLCFELIIQMEKRGLRYPDDLSLIVSSESDLCRHVRPALTSLQSNLEYYGSLAAEMLMDHLDHQKPLGVRQSRNDFPMELLIRQSCVPPCGSGYVLKKEASV